MEEQLFGLGLMVGGGAFIGWCCWMLHPRQRDRLVRLARAWAPAKDEERPHLT